MLQLLTAEVPQTRDEIEFELLRVRGEIEIRELYFSRLAAALRALDLDDEGEQEQSTVDWLRHNCRLTQPVAVDRVRIGEKLAVMPATENCLYTGEVGIQHLAVMARTAAAIGEGFDESKLLPLAKKHSPGRFHHESLHYRHSLKPKEVAAEQAHLAENRSLSLSTAEDGCLLLNGVLDPVAGAEVRTALEALARPLGKDDHRVREKRLADALHEALTRGGNVKVQMQVTSSVETLLGLLGAPGAENEFSLPISSRTVERWACDCSLTRVLMQDSVVVDVGRSQRVIAGPKRRALIARDKHCK
ncbi:MAG TPA: DUF222 domain-containing protein [Candidatus Dormibacteraeota bacterium]|nr:DUF222 domain-containing protein [Candidatus Dormibacteraeota bacterium]